MDLHPRLSEMIHILFHLNIFKSKKLQKVARAALDGGIKRLPARAMEIAFGKTRLEKEKPAGRAGENKTRETGKHPGRHDADSRACRAIRIFRWRVLSPMTLEYAL